MFTGVAGSGKSSLIDGSVSGRDGVEGTPADLVAARPTLTGEHLAAYVGT